LRAGIILNLPNKGILIGLLATTLYQLEELFRMKQRMFTPFVMDGAPVPVA
jgi:hypothetical protein